MLISEGVCGLQEQHAPARTVPRSSAQQQSPRPSLYLCRRPILDRFLAVLLLVPGSFIIAILAVAVRLTSRGPAIYRQSRLGKDGRVFQVLKIRTMYADAEARTGPVWTRPRDPRITPVGRIIRKLHLDELPQLLNVVRGEMCLIGPRPERPEFARVLSKIIPQYDDRLLMLPGITGLAQINLTPDQDLENVRRKVILDLAYIQEASFLLDTRILLCSAIRAVGVPGEYAMRVCRLERRVELPQGQSHAPAGSGDISVTPSALEAQSRRRSTAATPAEEPKGQGLLLPEATCGGPERGSEQAARSRRRRKADRRTRRSSRQKV